MDDFNYNNEDIKDNKKEDTKADISETDSKEDFKYSDQPYYGYSGSHEEKSYTPPFHESKNNTPQNLYPVSPNGGFSENNFSADKKIPKPVTTKSVFISCLISALVASLITATIFVFGTGAGRLIGNRGSSNTSETDSSVTNNRTSIISDSTDEAIVEAVAESVSPSVVGIVVTNTVGNFFYGNSEQSSQGSGIIYSSDGYIITNYHVISAAVESNGVIKVYLPTDIETGIDASVTGYDVSSDLAVIKINSSGLTAIEIGDSSALKVGQTAIAVGNPGGITFMGSVSKGIISGLDRVLQLENTKEINLIQTDAAINPGNSGGALVNSNGQLIGVNSAKMASSDYEGMGFAIPVNSVVEICTRIIQNEDAPTPYVGVEINTRYDSNTLKMMGYPAGVVVSRVVDGSPADNAGIEQGDIITEFNGTSVTSYSAFNSEKLKCSPNQEVTLTVYRAGRTYSVKMTLGTAND